MLRYHIDLKGLKIRTADGDVGHIDDCYFDDSLWAIRYLIADTGGWLSGRQVLIAPAAVRHADWSAGALHVGLTRQQVQNSPDVAAHKPISRQLEERLLTHYGWPVYWAPTAGDVDLPPPGHLPPRVKEKAADSREQADTTSPADAALRSMGELTGYHIRAADGAIGHVEDYIVDHRMWVVRFVLVDTANWLPGRKVLLAPDWFTTVNWADCTADVDMTRQAVKDSPRYEPTAPVGDGYVGELHDYYGRPNRWSAAAAAPVHW